jgi:hypothetical protein
VLLGVPLVLELMTTVKNVQTKELTHQPVLAQMDLTLMIPLIVDLVLLNV